MVPTPYFLNDRILRIFITMCDSNNVGRIGYVDVDPNNPSKILNYSKFPALDIGYDGCFDDNGVVTASVLSVGDELWMYYSGYQLAVKVPYLVFGGLAMSKDNGNTFKRYSVVPILDRIEGEINSRCAPFVIKDENKFKMYYLGDYKKAWINHNGKHLPYYTTKHIVSDDGMHWPNKEGEISLDLQSEDEHGLPMACVWEEKGLYRMIYSIRSISQGYRLGYAESKDGIKFERMDRMVGIDVSESGWDSEMICWGKRLRYKDKTYLFYSGNHYGLGGFGYAELVKE
jgi:hypothetical protein